MFGVLCIHASSDAMRRWLWQDICRVPRIADSSLSCLVLHALLCVSLIMLSCSLLDLVRQKLTKRLADGRVMGIPSVQR